MNRVVASITRVASMNRIIRLHRLTALLLCLSATLPVFAAGHQAQILKTEVLKDLGKPTKPRFHKQFTQIGSE